MKTAINSKKDLQHLELYLNLIELKFNLYIISFKSWIKAYNIFKELKEKDNEYTRMLIEKLAKSLKEARVILIREENEQHKELLKELEEYLGKSRSFIK